jgi:ribosome biogenesis protein Nip4
MNRKIRKLERIYLTLLCIILLLIVFTPYLIRSGLTVFEEELVEVAVIILLFAVGYGVLFFYRKEIARSLNEACRLEQDKGDLINRLSEAFGYIGTVNIQIQQIKSFFSDIKKFPEDKKDFFHILQLMADRILCMVNVDWILFRIIDIRNLNTLSEYRGTRGNTTRLNHKIGNKALALMEKLKGVTVVESGQENFHIKTFCIIPEEMLSGDQKVFIKAVVNQLEMLFLIFTSIYYKESRVQNGGGGGHT